MSESTQGRTENEETRAGGSQTKTTFDLLMRNAFACVKLAQPDIDLREKHQAFNRILERRIVRKIAKRLDCALSHRFTGHERILALPIRRGRQCQSMPLGADLFA